MARLMLFVAATLGLASRSLPAQVPNPDRHPRGADVFVLGTLVDPLCALVQLLADSAQLRCSKQGPDHDFHPVVLTPDSELYVLVFDATPSRRRAAIRWMVGKEVKVDGIVYPMGNAYLLVVDSVRPWSRPPTPSPVWRCYAIWPDTGHPVFLPDHLVLGANLVAAVKPDSLPGMSPDQRRNARWQHVDTDSLYVQLWMPGSISGPYGVIFAQMRGDSLDGRAAAVSDAIGGERWVHIRGSLEPCQRP